MEIHPNVHWLDGQSSNLYLCVDEDGLTLIDTGMPKRQELVLEAIHKIGRQPSDLVRILITHADLDHAGSAADIQAKTGAAVYASAATAALLRRGKFPKHMPRLRQLVLDHFLSYRPLAAETIQVVENGDELPVLGGLQVLATPGHTPDHHSFYSPATGVLFAGDALNTRDDVLNRTPPRITADEDEANCSAIRLIELAPATFACGHGQPMTGHTTDDLMRFFNKLRQS